MRAQCPSHLRAALREFMRRYGDPRPRDAMRSACAELRRQSGVLDVKHEDLQTLCATIGAVVGAAPIAQRGTLRATNDAYEITVRSGLAQPARNFIVAHELGHILLLEGVSHDDRALACIAGERNHPALERMCDLAAMELLLPAINVRGHAFAEPPQVAQLAELAVAYGVSIRTVIDRLCQVVKGLGWLGLESFRVPRGRRSAERGVKLITATNVGRTPSRLPFTVPWNALSPDILSVAERRGVHVSESFTLRSGREVDVRGRAIAIHVWAPANEGAGGGGVLDDIGSLEFVILVHQESGNVDDWAWLNGG